FLDRWLQESKANAVRPRTYRSYRELIELHLKPGLGKIALVSLNGLDVERFQNAKLARGASPRRVKMMRDVLRAALNKAVRWRLVRSNVVNEADPPHVPQAE